MGAHPRSLVRRKGVVLVRGQEQIRVFDHPTHMNARRPTGVPGVPGVPGLPGVSGIGLLIPRSPSSPG